MATLCLGCAGDDSPQLSMAATFSTEHEPVQDNTDNRWDDSGVSIGDTEELSSSDLHENLCDGEVGQDTTITLSYQTTRPKSWNNRWLLEQSWGSVVAAREIYAAFWAVDEVLATMDAVNNI